MDEHFNLREWLLTEIGLEEPKDRRRNLFNKLCRLHAKYGNIIIGHVAQVWSEVCDHCNRSTPSRMFCCTIKRRLADNNLWHEPREYEQMALGDLLASGILRRKARMPLFEPGETTLDQEKHITEGRMARPCRPGHHPRCTNAGCPGCA